MGSMVLAFLAYNQFFDQSELASPNATASSYMDRMEREQANHAASHIAGHFEMYHEAASWVWGAYMASSDEAKEEWRKDKEFLMMLGLSKDKVEDWGKCGDEKEMMEKEMMEKREERMDEKKEGAPAGPPKLM